MPPTTKKYSFSDADGTPKDLPGALKPGSTLATGVAAVCDIKIGGLERFRIYFKSTAAGTLSAQYQKANTEDTTLLTIGNPANVTIVANTENKMDVNPHFGERGLRVTFTPSGNGVVSTAEYCGVAAARR